MFPSNDILLDATQMAGISARSPPTTDVLYPNLLNHDVDLDKTPLPPLSIRTTDFNISPPSNSPPPSNEFHFIDICATPQALLSKTASVGVQTDIQGSPSRSSLVIITKESGNSP